MGDGTASADPARLEAAALAVPEELRTELVKGHQRLDHLLETFSRSTQSPDRIFINPDYITGWMGRAYGRGNELDQRLIRIAGAFRAAGDGRPPGFVGPVLPGARFMPDDEVQAELDRWNDPQALQFRPGDDGTYQVRGRDGHWYTVSTTPPPRAVALDRRQEVVDLDDSGYGLSALITGAVIGFLGGSTSPQSRPAPPGAYDYIHLDQNGNPVAGPGLTGHSSVPGSLPPGDAPPEDMSAPYPAPPGAQPPPDRSLALAKGEGSGLLAGAITEMNKYADEQHRNVLRTQTTYYVDPHSGDRVAVVDAASIRYDNDTNEAVVTSGRLSTGDDGQPELVPQSPEPQPSDPNAPICLPPPPSAQGTNILHIPLEEG
jgi:hypothetical protein